MNDLPAVFVSYSREDIDAARRIAEGLRAGGVEVWLDLTELRGGDAWDANIKRQIRDCALFVAVISKQTQVRREGYFRLEWLLAEERSRLMARGTPFLVPVVIDDTPERDALVPETFLAVQWTRLPGGDVTPTFTARIRALLKLDGAQPAPGRAAAGLPAAAQPGPAPRGLRRLSVAAAGILVLAGAGLLLWKPWRHTADGGTGSAAWALWESGSFAPCEMGSQSLVRPAPDRVSARQTTFAAPYRQAGSARTSGSTVAAHAFRPSMPAGD